ncbi:MAG: transporter substrate-binding domain-containing protein [Oscillospiraceae bacterium]|nr:transporter substrate-binding domain-containing protein [Oscillospiraceae bacterium]
MKYTVPLTAAALLIGLSLTGCNKVPANKVHSAADLVGKTIACQYGTTGYIFAGDVENASVVGYNTGSEAIEALKSGQADAVIIDNEPAKLYVSQDPSLTILADPFAEEEYAIAYRIGNDELGEKLDEALSILKKDGTLGNITSHWIGENADYVSYQPSDEEHPNGQLFMATNAEFPPYEFFNNGEIVGIDADMMRAVCDKLGMELVIQNMEFQDILTAVEDGRADVGVAGITDSDERREIVDFTQSYAVTTQVIIVRS